MFIKSIKIILLSATICLFSTSCFKKKVEGEISFLNSKLLIEMFTALRDDDIKNSIIKGEKLYSENNEILSKILETKQINLIMLKTQDALDDGKYSQALNILSNGSKKFPFSLRLKKAQEEIKILMEVQKEVIAWVAWERMAVTFTPQMLKAIPELKKLDKNLKIYKRLLN